MTTLHVADTLQEALGACAWGIAHGHGPQLASSGTNGGSRRYTAQCRCSWSMPTRKFLTSEGARAWVTSHVLDKYRAATPKENR